MTSDSFFGRINGVVLIYIAMRFLDNEWGWDIEKTPPFLAYRPLRRRAAEKHGESNILDISQGEPGYGFAPSTRSRRFYAFLVLADTVLNNNQTEAHVGVGPEQQFLTLEDDLKTIAHDHFVPAVAKELLTDLEFFLAELERITTEQGIPKARWQILFDIFKFSILTGGRYPNSWGELIVRMAVADERTAEFGFPVNFEDIVIVNGCSHALGMFFKGLGEEGVGFLKAGDAVLMISPVYAPYTQFVEKRGLTLINISIDPETGKLDEASFIAAKNSAQRIKAIILIDPNNPTGFPLETHILEKIAEIAEENNAIILSDEVYAEFFPGKQSIVQIPAAQKRTIRVNSLSKIERATGLRFGDIYLPPVTRKFIAEEIIEKDCPGFTEHYEDFRWFMFLCKSTGGSTIGVFQHISGAPGTTQMLGLCHIILGKAERKAYVAKLRQKLEVFYEALGMKARDNNYYAVFDIGGMEGPVTAAKPIEQVLTELAEKGVVLMPAYRFFSAADRASGDKKRFVRASLPNLSVENSARAGRIIREHISE